VSFENGVETLSIWDSKESEFSSGLEYSHSFRYPSSNAGDFDQIRDLDWTSTSISVAKSTSSLYSILAVGFTHRVVILCQQRMTYFSHEEAWGILGEIDMTL
jgi:hypothetical protein